MNTQQTFGRFDKHAAAILNALGYVEQRRPASWQDVGDAENGPKLVGGGPYAAWVRDMDGYDHVIIVADGDVADAFNEQRPPIDWFGPYDDTPDHLTSSRCATKHASTASMSNSSGPRARRLASTIDMDHSALFRLLDAVAALVMLHAPNTRREIVAAASMVVVANKPPTDAVGFARVGLLAKAAADAAIDADRLLADPTFSPLGRREGVLAAVSALCCADVAITGGDWFDMMDVMARWPFMTLDDGAELLKFNAITFMIWVDANV